MPPHAYKPLIVHSRIDVFGRGNGTVVGGGMLVLTCGYNERVMWAESRNCDCFRIVDFPPTAKIVYVPV